jgi:hypothetical protein
MAQLERQIKMATVKKVEYRPVPDFPNYEISYSGTVRNVTTKEKMAVYRVGNSPRAVMLSRDGRQYSRSVLQLVEQAWFGSTKSYKEDSRLYQVQEKFKGNI